MTKGGSVRRVLWLLVVLSAVAAVAAVFAQSTAKPSQDLIDRGRVLVTTGGCGDCHSPKTFTAQGPVETEELRLSGHPANEKLPLLPNGVVGPGKWGALGSESFTAWYGPWGVSFAANLTPDEKTGLGAWTDEQFIKAMRTGKHRGFGRPIMPPMPWPNLAQQSDEDLRAIFAYLRSLPPVENQVPAPIPPAGK
jgi:mono/diheme cytochrome c family protein